MARFPLALLLLFFAVFTVMVSAAEKPPSKTTAEAPAATTPTDVEGVPAGDANAIGTTDDDAAATPGDDDVAVAGPVGSDSSHDKYPPPQQTETSGSCATCTIGFAIISAATVGSLFLIF
ncbi:Anther-specific protein agp1-like protein [Hirschfeldia incana]|nr:Anther-specific protein agp1-like protein [Hirschfeldia incana]